MGFFENFAQGFEDIKSADNGSELVDGTELYMEQKSEINDTYDIVDADRKTVYRVNGKFTSLAFQLTTADGAVVADIKKKFMALTPTYTISFANGQNASVKKKASLVQVEANGTVDEKELQIKGDIEEDNFKVYIDGQKIGAVAKKIFASGDSYVISFTDDSWKEIMVALVVIIDNVYHSGNGMEDN